MMIYFGQQIADGFPIRYEFSIILRGYIRDSLKLSSTETRKIETSVDSFMTTFFYDFHNSSSITPYLSISGGYVSSIVSFEDTNSAKTSSTSTLTIKSGSQPAWGVGIGFSYSLSTNWRADFSANYIKGGYSVVYSQDLDNQINKNSYGWKSVNVTDYIIGLRYKF